MDVDSQTRFLREAEITGQLEHPGVVPVYGLGTYSDGRPFYAMRFVEGSNLRVAIREFHRDRPLHMALSGDREIAFRGLLNRLISVCNTIEYAHSRGVLHRDLKPDNILIGAFGETLVVDWGLAKANVADTSPLPDERSPEPKPSIQLRGDCISETLDGKAIGTPGYMSPEQARGGISQLGPATDIYSLGATLFAILTGRPPITGGTSKEIIAKSAQGTRSQVHEYWPRVPPALNAICEKAMHLNADQRYPSARTLAEDIERWLADAPVTAYRENAIERTSRFIRRNQAACISAFALLTVALGAAYSITWFQSQLTIKDIEARNFQTQAIEQRLFADLTTASQRSAKRNPGWTWDNERTLESLPELSTREQTRQVLREEIAKIALSTDFREQRVILESMTVSKIAFSADHQMIAFGENTATTLQVHIRVLSAENYATICQLEFTPSIANALKLENDGVSSLCFAPDGKSLYVGSRGGELIQFEIPLGKLLTRRKVHNDRVDSMAISPDGTTVVTASRDGKLKWWNPQDGKELGAANADHRQVFSSNDKLFAFIDKRLKRYGWAPASKAEQAFAVDSHVLAIDSDTIAAASDEEIDLVGPFGKPFKKIYVQPPQDDVDFVSIGSRQRYLALSDGLTCDLWETFSGQKIGAIHGISSSAMAIDPIRPRVLIADGKQVRLFEIRERPMWDFFAASSGPIEKVAISNNRKFIATIADQGEPSKWKLTVWGSDPLVAIKSLSIQVSDPEVLAVADEGNAVSITDSKYQITEVTLDNLEQGAWSPLANTVGYLAYAPSGQSIWATVRSRDSSAMVDKLATWRLIRLERGQARPAFEWSNPIQQLTRRYSEIPDLLIGGNTTIAAHRQGVQIWSGDPSGAPIECLLPEPNDTVSRLWQNQAGALLLVGTRSGTLYAYPLNSESPAKMRFAANHSAGISALCSAVNDQYLLAGDLSGDIIVYEIDSDRLQTVARLGSFGNAIESMHTLADNVHVAIHIRGEHAVRLLSFAELLNRWRSSKLDTIAGEGNEKGRGWHN